MNGKELIKIVKEYFAEIRKMKEFAAVKDEELVDNGEIYYMNGNDSTAFDWNYNDCCCDFYLFYKETEKGFLKVFVYKSGKIGGYGYLDKGKAEAIILPNKHIGEEEALAIACLMQTVGDNEEIYDVSIEKMNFDVEINTRNHSEILRY